MVEQCISPYRVAKLLDCSYENIRLKCVRGEIEGARKFGDRWMIPVNSPSLPGNSGEDRRKRTQVPESDIDSRIANMRKIANKRKRAMDGARR